MSHSAGGFDPDVSGRRFDAVLVDIDHSPRKLLHPRHAALYASEGLARLAEHLRPGGVFALWSNDPPDDAFSSVLTSAFATSAAHVVTFDNLAGDGEASNTVYVAVKADLPTGWVTSETLPSAIDAMRWPATVAGRNLPLRNGHAMLARPVNNKRAG